MNPQPLAEGTFSSKKSWPGFRDGLLAYLLTSVVVIFGVSFGYQFVPPPNIDHIPEARRGFWETFSAHDGAWYRMIATDGYYYSPSRRSPVAFFPLFPFLAGSLAKLTGLEPTLALLVVSHGSLVAAFVVAAVYIRGRGSRPDQLNTSLTLLALGLMPATLFFRMTYSESTFLLVTLVLLVAIQRGWSLLSVAFVAGVGTACRPVGVGLLLPLAIYAWRCSPGGQIFFARVVSTVAVGCWGLLAYAIFLAFQFGDPLVFIKAQANWGSAPASHWEKILALISYEPIWQVYLRGPDSGWSVFTWELINPGYFLLSGLLIVGGAFSGRLNAYELSLAFALLFIPYFTRGLEMNMASSARFAAVVFPVYLVIGDMLGRLPSVASGALLAISAFFLGAFSALFAAGYLIF